MNIAILLAAGTSSRFMKKNTIPKQLFCIDQIPVIMYSLNILVNNSLIDKVLIVTSSNCKDQIENILNDNCNHLLVVKEKINEKVIILINDVNCRIESINTGINYINNSLENENDNIKNVIVHDSARPYIQNFHINELIKSMDRYLYTQYYMKLVNGLYNIKTNEFVDRDSYIEICTPFCIDYSTMRFIDTNKNTDCKIYEYIPELQKLNIPYNLIESYHKYLKKITTLEDL